MPDRCAGALRAHPLGALLPLAHQAGSEASAGARRATVGCHSHAVHAAVVLREAPSRLARADSTGHVSLRRLIAVLLPLGLGDHAVGRGGGEGEGRLAGTDAELAPH